MRICALDLSKTSTGFAVWGKGDERAWSGTWQLGSEYTSQGKVFCKLHQHLADIHAMSPIDALFYERPRHLDSFNQQSDANSHMLAVGLAAHVESFGDAMGLRIVRAVPMTTWRRDFLGKVPRHMRSADLKGMAMDRARQLGFKPQKHDEAEAIGILDHACLSLDLTPPWALQFALQAQSGRMR